MPSKGIPSKSISSNPYVCLTSYFLPSLRPPILILKILQRYYIHIRAAYLAHRIPLILPQQCLLNSVNY